MSLSSTYTRVSGMLAISLLVLVCRVLVTCVVRLSTAVPFGTAIAKLLPDEDVPLLPVVLISVERILSISAIPAANVAAAAAAPAAIPIGPGILLTIPM